MEIKRIPRGLCPICETYNTPTKTTISREEIYHHFKCVVCDQQYRIKDERPLISCIGGNISIPKTVINGATYFQEGKLAFLPWDSND